MNVTLQGKKRALKMWLKILRWEGSSASFLWALNIIKSVVIRETWGRGRKRSNVAMKAETRAMKPPVKDTRRWKSQKWILPRDWGNVTLRTPSFQTCVRGKFLLLSATHLWWLFTVALETHALDSCSCTGFPKGLSHCEGPGNGARNEHRQHLCWWYFECF